ncbi:LCP family protein [Desmospora profundinema]|uniref:LCP family protein required for cell wall assembly n=1 Tax=Desmospora profundinema TaxID=1571184 RepID=A0ABU1ILJ3_9BACL|nr:LCP family protein [Desmospora profundinema]MDR6225561.1 LCP family protein required for cell wall assembly [Desmospora profundinema]
MNRWVSIGLAIIALLTGAILLSWGIQNKSHPSTDSAPIKRQTIGQTNPPKTTNPSQSLLPTPSKEPVSLLLMGVDRRKGDKGRTDAIMLVVLNPAHKRVTLLNIPRDTKTLLRLKGGRQRWDKINHAYALGGGVEATVRTVETFLDVPVHHHLKIDMGGFRRIIDKMGGVDVEVEKSFSYKGHHFRQGPMHLNGSQALAYVRDRTGGSDYDRHIRQQQVLGDLWERGTRFSSLLNMQAWMPTLIRHVDTDLSPWEMWRLAATIRSLPPDRMQVLHLQGVDEWNDRYYLVVPQQERNRIRDILRKELQIDG